MVTAYMVEFINDGSKMTSPTPGARILLYIFKGGRKTQWVFIHHVLLELRSRSSN